MEKFYNIPEPNSLDSMEGIEAEKEVNIEKASELIEEMRDSLDSESREKLEKFLIIEDDSEEVKEKFDIVSVSDELSDEIRLFIEAQKIFIFFKGENWKLQHPKFNEIIKLLGFHNGPRGGIMEGFELLERITNGDSNNPHNLNHVVFPEQSSSKGQSFSMESKIHENSRMHFASGKNRMYGGNIGNPMIILKPEDPEARNFVKEINPKYWPDRDDEYKDENGTSLIKFLNNAPMDCQDISLDVNELEDENSVKYKSGVRDMKYRWIDIASMIIDLRKEKVYIRKITNEQKKEVAEDIDEYNKIYGARISAREGSN